ncbi:hypothetical protein [Alicycliphilus denitrificans]|uniref:hypothetical protein n=1 Tax=Alicycliphilus denitrificans TaxID=179636 RepID=UPI0001D9FE85|nr:hypothetical protein [Alicycliphilus denitrificans]ADU99453.1 hypothetical protein Alide_1698 [Alicycliphilus denitrificans BC]
MADMDLNGPAEIVEDKYERSVELAETASREVADFQRALNDSIYQPPQISVQWQTMAAPSLPAIPNMPALPGIDFTEPGGQPGGLTATMRDVAIDDLNIQMPTLDFGQAPVLTIGQAPALPEVRDVAIPDAPDITLPDAPQFLALQTHSFGGVNLHEEWLDKLDDIPELSILQPTPFQYSPGARYASQLLDNLKATLNARIQGGSGIVPAVEQQIWDRARDRETQIALAREQEVLRGAEALGFPLPSGVLAGQLADARREYHDKLSGLSRDIAIKQAELEQQNMRDSIQAALQLESTLLEDCYKLEMLAFEAAKTAADNAIAAHNAALEHFKALLAGYQAYAAAYDTVVKAELSKVEVFKALLSAEETKASINKSLVDRYKAEIEGGMAAVEIYKARVGAAQTLVELERARIQAGGEQVRAFVATVNAETAKAEMYKTRVSAEATKVEAVGAVARAYGSKVGAQAEKARVEVAKFQALVSAKGLEWDGWKARLQAAVSRMDAAARTSSIVVDGYRLGAHAAEAQAQSVMRQWEASIKQYEASKDLTFRVASANAQAVMHANDARMEAAKVMLATGMQKVASSWSAVSASASISGNVTQSITG